MKKILPILLSINLFSSISAYADANDQHIDQFKETGICIGCDLSKANLRDLKKPNCILNQAILTEASLGYSSDYSYCDFSGVKASNASFSLGWETNYLMANFNNAVLIRSSFTNAILQDATFKGAQLYSVNFDGAILMYADFTGADVRMVDFRNANLFGAKITNEQLNTVKDICNAVLPDGSIGSC